MRADESAHSDAAGILAAKRGAALAALDWVASGSIIGVGTGSTAAEFVRAISTSSVDLIGAVASSVSTERLLEEHGIPVIDLNEAHTLPLYVDGADAIDSHLRLVKGAGGALTREKICAEAARVFVCIADESKYGDGSLGDAAVPVEVIPMARTLVETRLHAMGIEPLFRDGFVTDNGNQILDCRGVDLADPERAEVVLEALPGVVSSGVFAKRGADVVLLGASNGDVRQLGG